MRLFRINQGDEFVEYKEQDFKGEHEEQTLEVWLESNPDCIVEDGKLLIIGRQVSTNLGTVIDLLAIDREGDVAVIELKRDKTPRETLAQALEYTSFVAGLSYEQLEQILRDYQGSEGASLPEFHRTAFDLSENEAVSFNKEQRIVIIGQDVTPQIRQTANFLRQKGLQVTCLEFKYFQTNSGERLLSTDIVVGKEPLINKSITSVAKPRTDRTNFLESCDPIKRPIYEAILALADNHDLPIHWGVKGFSLNVKIGDRHVALCYGYPASAYNGQLYTAFDRISYHVETGNELVEMFRKRLKEAGFVSTGKIGEMKHSLEPQLSPKQTEELIALLADLAESARQRGLRQAND